MEVILRKMGNSTALIIPPPVLKDLGLAAGHPLKLEIAPGGGILLTPKRRYSLSELISQCDLNAPEPADMVLWEQSSHVGREIL